MRRGGGKASAKRPPAGGRPAGKPAGKKLAGRGRGGTLRLMGSLIKAAVLLGAIAAFIFLLPFGGRTLGDRWRAAGGAGDFAARLWSEMKGEPAVARHGKRQGGRGPGGEPSAGRPDAGRTDEDRTDEPQPSGDRAEEARPDANRPVEGRPGAGPTERHTDADRQALDRLLGDHLGDPPKR